VVAVERICEIIPLPQFDIMAKNLALGVIYDLKELWKFLHTIRRGESLGYRMAAECGKSAVHARISSIQIVEWRRGGHARR